MWTHSSLTTLQGKEPLLPKFCILYLIGLLITLIPQSVWETNQGELRLSGQIRCVFLISAERRLDACSTSSKNRKILLCFRLVFVALNFRQQKRENITNYIHDIIVKSNMIRYCGKTVKLPQDLNIWRVLSRNSSLYIHKLIKSFNCSEIDIICVSSPIKWDLTESSFY